MTTKAQLLKSIRAKCLDCCVDQPTEVRLCAATACDLWPFRFGKDPDPPKVGFAKNPPASRAVSSNKSNLKGGAPPEKESPPEVAASDGTETKSTTRKNEGDR